MNNFSLLNLYIRSSCHSKGYQFLTLILLGAQQSLQKCSDPSGFLANSMGAPNNNEDSCIALASSNPSSFFLISNYSQGLCLHIDFLISLVPSTRDISYISYSFRLGGALVGNIPGNKSQYLHNTVHNNALFLLSTVSGELLFMEGLYIRTIYLTGIIWGYLMFLIIYHT